MRRLFVAVLLVLGASPVALASVPMQSVSNAGVTLRIPSGWRAAVGRAPACDPERLIAFSSGSFRIGSQGQLAPPRSGQVLVLLLEDRYRQDRPSDDLVRPTHFSVSWTQLARIKPACGLPSVPGFMRYFKTQGRYLGFIVYPGAQISRQTRRQTLAAMDSMRVKG